jgi:hypothetical protein
MLGAMREAQTCDSTQQKNATINCWLFFMMKTKRLPFTAKVMFTIAGFNKKKLGKGLDKSPNPCYNKTIKREEQTQ